MEKVILALKKILGQKWKFVLLALSTLVFTFLLFPFDDLGDLVTSQVSQLTNRNVFVQFDRMKVGLLPEAGLQLQNVYLEGQGIPPLTATEVTLTPSISSLIAQKPGGTLNVKGLFKGEVELSLKPGTKSENGLARQKINLVANKLNLADIKDFAQLPLSLKGRVNITSQALADLSFTEQPDMDISLQVDKFELPSGNIQTPMGPLTLPEVHLTSINLKGRLSAGRFNIEEGQIGKDMDELKGTIKGGIALQLKMSELGLTPIIGAYDFTIDLNVKKGLQDRATLFLSFLDQFKTPALEGAHYLFKISALSPNIPPSISAAR